ncbi:MAG: hypothetical protein CSA96_05605 [Bacteroidetes bacterium]|nr:MAG: hypothetical protein CSA96_05605 [Bacteroidota bacterium]
MAKKTNTRQTDKNLEGIEQALTRSEQFIEDNQRTLTFILVALLAVLLVAVGGHRFYLKPKNEKAAADMYYAERFFEIDSFSLALNGFGTYPGFLSIMEDYKMTKSAKIAHYYAGVCFHQLGDHEAAVDYLSKYKTSDLLVGAAKYATLGDAYVELGEYDKALTAYRHGVDKYENSFSSPILLKKMGIVYEEIEDLHAALETYKRIESEFPETTEGREIRKYIGRVEAKLEQ